MARPKNPENKYDVRHAKLGVPVLDEKGNLLTIETKAAADVTPEDIKTVLSYFESLAEKDSSFKLESAIDTVFKLKDEVSESGEKKKSRSKVVSLGKDEVSDPSKTDKDKTHGVASDKDEVSDEESEEAEETDDDNTGEKPNE